MLWTIAKVAHRSAPGEEVQRCSERLLLQGQITKRQLAGVGFDEKDFRRINQVIAECVLRTATAARVERRTIGNIQASGGTGKGAIGIGGE